MQFAISGSDGSRFVSVTRSRASAASLLAEHWQKLGFTDIRIEWNGRSFDPVRFRAHRLTTDLAPPIEWPLFA